MVINVELRRTPKNSIVCDGLTTLLSRSIMNPRDTNWSIAVASCCRSVRLDWAMILACHRDTKYIVSPTFSIEPLLVSVAL